MRYVVINAIVTMAIFVLMIYMSEYIIELGILQYVATIPLVYCFYTFRTANNDMFALPISFALLPLIIFITLLAISSLGFFGWGWQYLVYLYTVCYFIPFTVISYILSSILAKKKKAVTCI